MPRWTLALFGASLLVACPPSGDDTDDTNDTDDTDDTAVEATPVVTVSATKVFLIVGETSTATAVTANATDTAYTWTTSDPLVATVTDAGLVTGTGHGAVTITATGATSQAWGQVDLTVWNEVPNLDEWAGSAHAAYDDEVFTHWNEDGEVPASCARCHTTTGYRDYLGDDGTAVDSVDGPHPIGQVIECEACHNGAANALTHVVFPSGVRIDDLGAEALCMTCHQGLASGDSVEAAITLGQTTGTQPAGDDLVDSDIAFVNIHYYAAGATLFGGTARGGYQYEGEIYDRRFRHVTPLDVCTECHDPHTLELQFDACAECHPGVDSVEDARTIRMIASSTRDYDGDENVTEGLSAELAGMQALLYSALKQAATETTGAARICYDGVAYPYWFVDTNANGACDGTEASFPNRYVTWTPRMARAAYNYQLSLKDPGAYAHNGKYVIQLLHDSVADLNVKTTTDVDLTDAVRSDPGHFDGTAEAFRHWDTDEAVDGTCSKCHGGSDGFAFYAEYGGTVDVLEHPNGLQCDTCHGDWDYQGAAEFRAVASVTFPSGTVLGAAAWTAPTTDMLCATCHSGREAKSTIDAYLAINNGTPGKYPTFRNVHYLPAAATLQGSAAHVGYEYDGKTYSGKWDHFGAGQAASCSFCHDGSTTGHTFDVRETFAGANSPCTTCHGSVFPDADVAAVNYDGNAGTTTLKADLTSFQDALLAAMRSYAALNTRQPICYDSSRYPYWFVDAGAAGAHCGPEDTAGYPRSATGWDAAMVKAAHNYQLSYKDPGSWAHNMDYVTELLFDSIEVLDATKLGTLSRGAP